MIYDLMSTIANVRGYDLEANLYFDEDITAMLDSLQELFQERGDKVTATLIAERMQQKLRRHIHHHRAAYLYRLLGFESRTGNRLTDNSKCYVIPNLQLLAEKRAQFCRVNVSDKKKESEDKN
jgi:hypothetical protein